MDNEGVRIAVLGSVNMDLVIHKTRLARRGETLTGQSFETGPGGKGLNQAVAARRAGAAVDLVGAVGMDPFGETLYTFLAEEGLGLSAIRRVPGMTGIAQVAVLDGGENSIVVVPGANSADDLSSTDRAVIAAADVLLVQLERPLSLVGEALAYARSNGVRTVLTPAPVTEGIHEFLPLVDVLIPNEGEASQLAGGCDAAQAAQELSHVVGIAVVTCGGRGAIVARDGRVEAHIPAHQVFAVDTTGAGDTFVGAFASWWARGESIETALMAGSAAAGIAITRRGAAQAAPNGDEIRALLANSSATDSE